MISSHNILQPLLVIAAVAPWSLTACGTYAQQGASQGAAAGFLGGAVAGAVGSIFWGGNVVENMVAAGVTTAAAGAVVGAASGNQADKAAANKQALVQRDQALEEKLGPDNFIAARDLAQCKHGRAITEARDAYTAATTDDRRIYALAIEAIAAEESGDTATAAAVYPKLSTLAPDRGSPEKLRSDALAAILQVQKARTEHGFPPTCA